MKSLEVGCCRSVVALVLAGASVLCFSSPPVVADAYENAVAAVGRGDYEVAESELAAYLEGHPEFASGHRFLGQCRMKLGRLDEARSSLETAQELGDRSFVTTSTLARLDLKQKRAAPAAERLATVVITELGAEELLDRAELLLEASRLEKEAGHYESSYRAARLVTESPGVTPQTRLDALYLAASSALIEGDSLAGGDGAAASAWFDDSLRYTQAATSQDRQDHAQRVARLDRVAGLVHSRRGHTELACASFQAEVDTEATVDGFARLGRCRGLLGDWEAVKSAAQAGLDPQRAPGPESEQVTELHSQLARALHHLGEYGDAVVSYRLAGLEKEAGSLESALEARQRQDAEEARCAALIEQISQQKESSEWEPGTPEWNLMLVELEKKLETCAGQVDA